MKKTFILSIAIFGLYLFSLAHPVHQETAQSIAAKFMGVKDLQLITTYQTERNAAAFYVFNTLDGFVIVSADDCETPIIGYSHEGRFDPNNVPIQMEGYLQDFVARIQYGIENHIVADEVTTKQWELVKATGRLNDHKDTKAVGPLLTDKWNQGCLYNSLCPTMSGPCDHAEVGCVAVAMGQIMHYWGYPTTGWGSHSYKYYTGGPTLSADFGNTTYDWEHMPDSLTENSSEAEIEAVATLLFHCGVAVEMSYSPSGSTSTTGNILNALPRYFNYSRQIHKEKKNDYTNEAWSSLLMNCLDLSRPIQYVGFGSAGHSFVCDGYDSDGLFHFNWGWGVANGYYALGNLNPIGYSFNNDNYAILDIFPHYEPCLVNASVFPSNAGTIEGCGEYHIGELCTLTVTPNENYDFYCWKQNGEILSNMLSVTIPVENDTVNIESNFSCFPIGQITASYSPDASNTNVNLSWSRADTVSGWNLLKQFEIGEEIGGMATNGEHIYVTYAYWEYPAFSFGKYTMDGEFLERFNLEGIPEPLCLAYDGTNYYCNSGHSGLGILYRIDLDNKTIIDSTDMGTCFGALTYDPEYDGFWLGHNYQTILYSRQGQRIQASPTKPDDYLNGTGYCTAKDGTPHLLLSRESGVYDYDINNNVIFDQPLLNMDEEINSSLGTCTWMYNGKEALFIVINNIAHIFEIKNTLAQISQIIHYRIYRSNSEGNIIMLADEVDGSSYLDTTWGTVIPGNYQFGISEVYANGNESEIIWSDTIVKSGIGIDEHTDNPTEQAVQKVIENGHIVIIKDGKRYTITGQQLN